MVCFRTIRCNPALPVVPKGLDDRNLAGYCQEMRKK
jgi:hypothetical protein